MGVHGVPREQIPWFPTIDYEKCNGCQECYNFCKNKVFEWDENEHHPIVVNPYNCVIGCSTCAQLCDQEAIMFPSRERITQIIRELSKKK